MSKSFRIKATPDSSEKYVTIKLEQDFDTLEILSLKLSQTEIYSTFNADYGVLVGRVIANGGIGIPNAKISVFIPITDDDKMNPDILAIYPFESTRDKDSEGRKYNLLPRVAMNNPFVATEEYVPITPVGSFPTKEEVVTNTTFLEVYAKYYKYTTVTNQAGDYMIFGVPVGVQTVHMSADVTDIGKYSMTPGTMINQLGYSPNLFTQNGTRIKFSTDLDILPNVELQEISVDVRSFWGDEDNFEIGITRQDFKLRAILASAFTVFGSAFTDAFRSTWGQNDHDSGDQDAEMWRINDDAVENVSVSSKRIGPIAIDVYTISPLVSEADAIAGNFDTKTDIIKIDPSVYTQYIRDGDFVLTIPCNRSKVVTDEFGNDLPVDDNDPNGVFTKFRGMFICRYAEDTLNLPAFGDIAGGKFDNHTFQGQRWRMKIPQNNPLNQTLNSGANETFNENWRKEHHEFQSATLYSIAKFQDLNYRDTSGGNDRNDLARDPFWNVGVIVTGDQGDFPDNNPDFQFPPNGTTDVGVDAFGAEWINFCLHFPQDTYFLRNEEADRHGNDSITFNPTSRFFFLDNTQKLLGSDTNTRNFLRGDFHFTKFVEVPREDVINIFNNAFAQKGFTSIQPPFTIVPLIGTEYQGTTAIKYFYRGIGAADCIDFLVANGIVGT